MMAELAEIFRRHGPAYRAKFKDQMLPSHVQAMEAIEQCRTEELGGHVYFCERCQDYQYSYHSCKNRHCPKCQNGAANAWLQRQQEMLLPVPYFLVTFTLPEALRELTRRHQKLLYNTLFRTSAAALQTLALDPRFVGGTIGMIGVLHTWTRAMHYHPHVHYLVPAGGLAQDGQHWLPSREDFLVPVTALSVMFRAKFRDALRKSRLFDLVPPEVWEQDWVVHCEPVGTGAQALQYLAPYVFRVAISNNRILTLGDGQVTFQYKDSQTKQTKICTLSAEAFIRRFLQHVLPDHFVKVRYYGLLSPGNRAALQTVRELLGVQSTPRQLEGHAADSTPATTAVRCPRCGNAMELVETLRPKNRSP
jgi:putative transposase/transposase-like zinc-binding protein